MSNCSLGQGILGVFDDLSTRYDGNTLAMHNALLTLFGIYRSNKKNGIIMNAQELEKEFEDQIKYEKNLPNKKQGNQWENAGLASLCLSPPFALGLTLRYLALRGLKHACSAFFTGNKKTNKKKQNESKNYVIVKNENRLEMALNIFKIKQKLRCITNSLSFEQTNRGTSHKGIKQTTNRCNLPSLSKEQHNAIQQIAEMTVEQSISH